MESLTDAARVALILSLIPAGGRRERLALSELNQPLAQLSRFAPGQWQHSGWSSEAAREATYYLSRPQNLPGYNAALRWLETADASILCREDPDYPTTFTALLADAPMVLYCRGNTGLLRRPQVAMVGSRSPGEPTRRLFMHWACQLAGCGPVITSGLARGLDAAAHQGVLRIETGQTLAVLGGGLSRIYPGRHRLLAENILTQGGLLVSEYPPWEPARPGQFPQRNRLVAAMADAVIVAEAAERSGSLITARLAAEYGKTVFVVPDHPFNRRAWGGLELVRDGAEPIWRWRDCLAALPAHEQSDNDLSAPASPQVHLTAEENQVMARITTQPVAYEVLQQGLPDLEARLPMLLLSLEMDGMIQRTLGGYQRIRGL